MNRSSVSGSSTPSRTKPMPPPPPPAAVLSRMMATSSIRSSDAENIAPSITTTKTIATTSALSKQQREVSYSASMNDDAGYDDDENDENEDNGVEKVDAVTADSAMASLTQTYFPAKAAAVATPVARRTRHAKARV